MSGTIAIVGRPNVGKSTIFNRIAGSRVSIVEDMPGVTRDRIYASGEWTGHTFHLIDTGGIQLADQPYQEEIRAQVQIAIEEADVIIMVCNGKEGMSEDDRYIAGMLQRSRKPVVLAVNQIDDDSRLMNIYEFYALGLGDPIAVSGVHGIGIGDVLDACLAAMPEEKAAEETEGIHIAVIGQPNVGKSSLVNKILHEERSIVSNIQGTTRDAIDTDIVYNGKEYVFIDTAGLRRKNKIKEELERYSIIRTVTAVERADVVLMVIDATEGVTEQDAKIAGIAHDKGKGIIVVVNKWDAIEKNDKTIYDYTKKIKDTLSFMPYAEYVFISALTGQRMGKLFELIDMVRENQTLRVQTGVLNEIVTEAVAMQQPPSDKGKRLKIYYTTQVSVKPPTFVVFVNDKELMHFSYTRYLENKIRESFGFRGTSMKFIIRERKEKE